MRARQFPVGQRTDAHETREYLLLMLIISDRGESISSAAHIVRTIAAFAKHSQTHIKIHCHAVEDAEAEYINRHTLLANAVCRIHEYRCIVCTPKRTELTSSRAHSHFLAHYLFFMTLFAFIYLFIFCARFSRLLFFLSFGFAIAFRFGITLLRAKSPEEHGKEHCDYLNHLDFGLWSFIRTEPTALQSPAPLESGTPFSSERTNAPKKNKLFSSRFPFFSCSRSKIAWIRKRNLHSPERNRNDVVFLRVHTPPSALLT